MLRRRNRVLWHFKLFLGRRLSRVSRKLRPRNLKRVFRPTHLMKTVYAWRSFTLQFFYYWRAVSLFLRSPFSATQFLSSSFFFTMLVFSGTTHFSERLFVFGTTFFFWHDFSFSTRLFFLARLFFFGTTSLFWHEFLFLARLFVFCTTFFFFGTTYFCGGGGGGKTIFYSTVQVTADLSQFHLIRKFNMVAAGCLKCRFLLFLLLISFSTCTGVFAYLHVTPPLNVERVDLIERYF